MWLPCQPQRYKWWCHHPQDSQVSALSLLLALSQGQHSYGWGNTWFTSKAAHGELGSSYECVKQETEPQDKSLPITIQSLAPLQPLSSHTPSRVGGKNKFVCLFFHLNVLLLKKIQFYWNWRAWRIFLSVNAVKKSWNDKAASSLKFSVKILISELWGLHCHCVLQMFVFLLFSDKSAIPYTTRYRDWQVLP